MYIGKKLFNVIPVLFLFIILILSIVRLIYKPARILAQSGSIIFGMAGDYGTGTQFHNTINGMKTAGVNFVVASGDFSYSPGSSATTWDNYILSTLGGTFPFELIAGNHDVGYLSDFTTLLPNRISTMSTDSLSKYAEQYYFDYPVVSPLIRVIMLGPNDSPINYTYAAGSVNYNWVQNAIRTARTANIPWVAVAMHKNCITSGTKSCEIGTAVFNLFINEHVDVILQAHDHTYQRSFPLHTVTSDPVNGVGCTSVTTTFNSACVSTTSGNTYPRSAGTTLVIDGAGGQSLYANNQTSQNGFFAARNFSSYGFTKFTVTASQISASFINNSAGGFTDSFTITNNSGPTPTLGPTSMPTSTPTRTPTPTTPSVLTPTPTPNPNPVYTFSDFITAMRNYLLTSDSIYYPVDGRINMLDEVYIIKNLATQPLSPVPTAPLTFQPSAPYYATFFYQWYKTPGTDGGWSYWQDHSNNPPNTWFSYYLPDPNPAVFDPANELYSSNDYNNFKWQAGKMKEAKIEVAISSWWGPGSREDIAFNNDINSFMGRPDNPYTKLRWSIYYEDEGFADPSVATIVSDLTYIQNRYANSPYYLKINNKPVIFVYSDANDAALMTQRWNDANTQIGNSFYIVLKVFSGYAGDPNQPDSWHQYAPAGRSGSHPPHSYFVSPGFWLDDGSPERLVRNPTDFENAVISMVSANTTWKLIETWNEWGEGTSVEPGDQVRLNTTTGKEEIDPAGYLFKNTYMDILSRNLPSLE